MANTARLNKLADCLDQMKLSEFDMNVCERCIFAWALRLFGGKRGEAALASNSPWQTFDLGCELLGLSESDAEVLFWPDWEYNNRPYTATPRDAARVIRNIVAGNGVDWSILDGR